MMIIFADWQLSVIGTLHRYRPIPSNTDFYQQRLDVLGNLPSDWCWELLLKTGDDSEEIIPLTPVKGGASAILSSEQLAQVDRYCYIQLRGTVEGRTRLSNPALAYVVTSLLEDSVGIKEAQKMTSFEEEKLEALMLEIEKHPAIPGKDGFWMVWNPDTNTYEGSEFPLV